MSSLRHSLFHGSKPLPSPGAQAQHLLRKYCLGLPDTSWGARLSTSRSWTGDTGVMVLEGRVVSPGRGWLGLPRPCRERETGSGMAAGMAFCLLQSSGAGRTQPSSTPPSPAHYRGRSCSQICCLHPPSSSSHGT